MDPGTSAQSHHKVPAASLAHLQQIFLCIDVKLLLWTVLRCRSHHLISQAGWNRCNLEQVMVARGNPLLAYTRGPCLQHCMSGCSNTWTDASHAAQLGLLMSNRVRLGVGWSVLICDLASSVCVCVDVS